jgi:tellurite resistance protein
MSLIRLWRTRRIPPNLFGIAFGLTGLAATWRTAGKILAIPAAVPDAIYIVAGAVWVALLAGYVAQGLRQVLADLRDPVLGPFVSLAMIVPMLLGVALAAVAFTAGRVVVVVSLALTITVGGWLTGQWIADGLDQDKAHPGYFLPTVAGGLAGGYAAASVGLQGLAEASFGIGVICWLVLGSTLLYRLFFRPMLPAMLVPTLAIEVAPPAVAGFAYFALTGGAVDFAARALGGYVVLMALVQLRFVPLYIRTRFSPAFWSFTFSYAAVAIDALLWIAATRPSGATGYAVAVVTLITALIVAIAVRTIIAVARRNFLPVPPPLPVPRQEDRDADPVTGRLRPLRRDFPG